MSVVVGGGVREENLETLVAIHLAWSRERKVLVGGKAGMGRGTLAGSKG